ncbi:MAG: calcium-binding EGF-like domain-containing protein [Taibaiella sp.]|nr:calcium-binding EGF-like domain-containing protein [Taibaiella sp.]
MKTIKSILFSAIGFFAIAASVVGFSSCEQDSCTVLLCKNQGKCEDGLCQCPAGYEGSECETTVASKYVGKYGGTTRCNYNNMLFPIVPDTVEITPLAGPDKVGMKIRAGNTVLDGDFYGTVQGNTIVFETLISRDAQGVELARIDAFVKFDGNLINVFLQTINATTQEKQACSFIGKYHVPDPQF